MCNWTILIDTAPGVQREERICDRWQELEQVLEDLIERAEGIVLLVEKSRDFMLFGAEGNVACVQFCPYDSHNIPTEKLRPVMWIANEQGHLDEFIEFNLGGTGTDLPTRYCISPTLLIPVGKEYYETKALSDSVTWERE